MYEQDFYNVERVIAGYNGIELPEQFGVDFEEIDYPKTVQDQILKDQFDIQNNLTTRAKIMVRDNKDLTVEQAQVIIEENKATNGLESNQQPEQS